MPGPADVEVVQLDPGQPTRRSRNRASLRNAPGEVEAPVRRAKVSRKQYPGRGTKLQTQVPREWRQRVLALAREQGVRESDIVRTLLGRALGTVSEEVRDGEA